MGEDARAVPIGLLSRTIESIGRSVRLADKVFPSWLGVRRPGEHPGGLRESIGVAGRAATLQHVVEGRVRRTIHRDDLPRFLTTPEMEKILVAEDEMEGLVAEWDELLQRRSQMTAADASRLDAIGRGVTAHLKRVTDLLEQLGFVLEDHYDRMRRIANEPQVRP